jgi:hypothetical protein
MLGYIVGLVAAVLLLALVFTGFAKSSPRSGREAKPVQPEEPSADAPTPDRSSTATRREVSGARGATPPA